MEHFSASQILGSPLTADPHEAAHVVVRLSSIPHAGQGPSQKMIELKFTLVKGIVMGCGIARFGRRGLKNLNLTILLSEIVKVVRNWHRPGTKQSYPISVLVSIFHFFFVFVREAPPSQNG